MAVLLGTSKTRFADFQDPSTGIGAFLNRAYSSMQTYLRTVDAMVAEDTFVEDGVQNVAGFTGFDAGFSNIKEPTRRKVFTQTSKGTVFIKKRMFSTLRNNFDPRFINTEDKIFLRASKNLFRRKCEEIAFYENLLRLENLNDDPGFLKIESMFGDMLDSFMYLMNIGFGISELNNATNFFSDVFSDEYVNAPIGADLTSTLEGTEELIGNNINNLIHSGAKLLKTLFKLKEINERSRGSNFTRWVYDGKTADVIGLGPGVGVIELCLVDSIDTTTGVSPEDGSCTITIQDPYKLTMITDADIEIALRQAIAERNGLSGMLDVSANFQLEQAQELDRQLNELRRTRGVSEINFEFVFGSGNVIGKVIDTNFEFDDTTLTSIPAPHSLTGQELIRAFEVINKLSSYFTLQSRTVGAFQNLNKDFNPIRQRLRNEYAGHSIIQPMDAVHIFLNSNARDNSIPYDNRDTTSAGVMNQPFTDAHDLVISQKLIEQEHEAMASGISVEIYRLMRDPSIWRSDGSSVFAGIIETINQSYDANTGSFKMTANATNNLQYLKMTKLNIAPSLQQPTRFLDDPLTPFDIDVNSSTGLVSGTPRLSKENLARLKYMRFDDGHSIGETVKDQKNIFQDTEGDDNNREVFFQHVPGLIYKWKSGIVTQTLNVNIDRPLNGSGDSLATLLTRVPPITSASPFSGLDAADVISILVTGQPYNYNNFLQTSIDMGNFSVDNANNSNHYFNFMFDLLETNKVVNGNFIPAKSSAIDPRSAVEAFGISNQTKNNNQKIQRLQRELATFEDEMTQLSTLTKVAGISGDTAETFRAVDQRAKLRNKIAEIQAIIAGSTANAAASATSLNLLSNLPTQDISDLNKKLAYAVKKKPEEVRYNMDKNFFIVSNKYDQDTEIQAFATALDGKDRKLMDSAYKLPYSIAVDSANTLGFELFCDPNGNIVFRPPEYNKTPLSLLLKMINLSKGDGVSLAPKFVLDLFEARANTTEERLLELDLQIYRSTILLQIEPSSLNIKMLIKDSTTAQLDEREAAAKQGITNELLMPYFLDKSEAMLHDAVVEQNQATPGQLTDLIKATDQKIFPYNKVLTILNRVNNQLNKIAGRLDLIYDNGEFLSGSPAVEQLVKFTTKDANSSVNRLHELENIATNVSKRQLLLQTYSKLLQNRKYYADANEVIEPQSLLESATTWAASVSGINPDIPQLPQILRDLVENDLSNDDGPRSGKRFIINDDTIISMTFQNKTPTFNRVSVTGNSDGQAFDLQAAGGVPPKIPNLYTAEAADFDSWRQYGLREQPQPFHRVDFTSVETQCAPYAVFKLIEQRKQIHTGSVTVIGNEFYQPGDVVYLNDKSMLYYVTKVKHNMTFNKSIFTTTLELSFGRALGEYIPTSLDVIGQGMLSAQRRAYGNISARRSPAPADTVFQLDTLFAANYATMNTIITTDVKDSSDFYFKNEQAIRNIITRAVNKINDSLQTTYTIEIRGYFISDMNINGSSTLDRTTTLLQYAEESFTQAANTPQVLQQAGGKLDASKIKKMPPIDLSKDPTDEERKFRRFPSGKAWSMAATLIDNDGISLPLNAIDIVLVTNKSIRGDGGS